MDNVVENRLIWNYINLWGSDNVKKKIAILFIICMLMGLAICAAQENQTEQQKEIEMSIKAMENVHIAGPKSVGLLKQGTLNLPENFIFIPAKEGNRYLKAIGNSDDPKLVGLVLPKSNENWFIVIDYIDAGYIKDDDAKNWNIDDLFKSIKEGTEESNKDRKKRGFPELDITGWVEKPLYDDVNKRLIWSISAREKGTQESGINYNTYVLGREGYFEVSLVTDLKDIETQKPIVKKILESTTFVEGKRYSDFNADTDKVAEYGLAALIAGAAAKKLGFFALLAAFGVKFAKIIGIVVVAAGALGSKLWKKKKENKNTPPEE